jgi:hypothetical protein
MSAHNYFKILQYLLYVYQYNVRGTYFGEHTLAQCRTCEHYCSDRTSALDNTHRTISAIHLSSAFLGRLDIRELVFLCERAVPCREDRKLLSKVIRGYKFHKALQM